MNLSSTINIMAGGPGSGRHKEIDKTIGEGNLQKIGKNKVLAEEWFSSLNKSKNLKQAKEAILYLKSKGLNFQINSRGKNGYVVTGFHSKNLQKLIDKNKDLLVSRDISPNSKDFVNHLNNNYYDSAKDPKMYKLIAKAYGGDASGTR